MIFDPYHYVIYTIGDNFIIRNWDVNEGICIRSYKIETWDLNTNEKQDETGYLKSKKVGNVKVC